MIKQLESYLMYKLLGERFWAIVGMATNWNHVDIETKIESKELGQNLWLKDGIDSFYRLLC